MKTKKTVRQTRTTPEIPQAPQDVRSRTAFLALAGILVLSVFLRFWKLSSNPLWYGDELNILGISWNVIHGMFEYKGARLMFITYPALGFVIDGLAMVMFGHNVAVFRSANALCGVATVFLLYLAGKELLDRRTGLWAAFLYAVYPLAVLYGRWGFVQNPAGMLVVASLFFLLKYRNTRQAKWLYFGCVAASGSMLTVHWAYVFFPFPVLFAWLIDRRKTIPAVLLTASLPVLVLCTIALVQGKEFIMTMGTISGQAAGETSQRDLWGNIANFCNNYWNYFRIGPRYETMPGALKYPLKLGYFMAFGIIGLFCAPGWWRKAVLAGFFLFLSALVFYLRSNIPVFFYPSLFFLPAVALGLGVLVSRAVVLALKWSRRFFSGARWLPPGLTVAALLFFAPMMESDFRSVADRFDTPIDGYCVAQPDNLIAAAKWVNERVKKDDFVLCGNLAWALNCRTAELDSAMFSWLDKRLFTMTFDCHYRNARYLAMEDITYNYRIFFPMKSDETLGAPDYPVARMLSVIENEKWKMVKQFGTYTVYANPRFPDAYNEPGTPSSVITMNPQMYNLLGKLFFDQGKFEDALSELQKAVLVAPGDANNHFNVGMVLARLGRRTGAVAELEQAVRLDPGNQNARQGLAQVRGY